jgi:hypothetical protein
MPAGAAIEAAGSVLKIEGFDASRVLELRLLAGAHTPASRLGDRHGRRA